MEMERTTRRKEPKVISFNCAIISFLIIFQNNFKVVIATEIESLVESLFMEEDSSE